MRFPFGILESIAGLVAKEVIERVTGDDNTPDDPQEFAIQVAEAVRDNPMIDPERFTAELLMELLTEERSDQFLELLMKKLNMPMGGRLLRKVFDDQLPEVIRDPLLELIGYVVDDDGELVKRF